MLPPELQAPTSGAGGGAEKVSPPLIVTPDPIVTGIPVPLNYCSVFIARANITGYIAELL
jgi:hypothetical protein